MPVITPRHFIGVARNTELPADVAQAGGFKVARGEYDFASDGGTAGAISLLPADQAIPSGAIVLGAYLVVDTVMGPVAATPTGALGLETTTDLQAAAAYNAAPWATTGLKALAPVMTVASAIVLTAARRITFTIASANGTGGKFSVYVVYLDPA